MNGLYPRSVGRTGKIVTQYFTGPDLQDCDTKNALAQGMQNTDDAVE
jgi:hypothetical protein